jgi:ketosteroid isomerase-like protein
MSEGNLERLRRRLEQWNPKAEVEAARRGQAIPGIEVIDPKVTFEDAVLPDHAGETYHGYEGIMRATEQWVEAFESIDLELDRIVGTGDRVVSVHRARMKAKHTGIELDSDLAYIWTFRDGRVIHIKGFVDLAEALEAAGLSGAA